MIRRLILGFTDSDSGGPRWGSCIIFMDGTETVVIDGYTSTGRKKLIAYLKRIGCKRPWLYLTHAHGDHYDGLKAILSDSYFTPKGFRCYDPATIKAGANQNSAIRSDRNALISIINLAKSKNVPVKYVKSSDSFVHGEIKFKAYREQPAFTGNSNDPNGWEYLNNGSLMFHFYQLGTLVTGDGPECLGAFCKQKGIKVKDFQISHHGNSCNATQSRIMRQLGAVYCWDDSYDSGTEFLRYGRQRCIEAGIKWYGIHGDINTTYFNRKAVTYKNGRYFSYSNTYAGAFNLRNHTADIVRKVMRGEYGNDDFRVTRLLDERYKPVAVQESVNTVINTAKAIKAGTVNYGKNEARIAALDKKFGSGYGQLIQDYINVLFKVRDSV